MRYKVIKFKTMTLKADEVITLFLMTCKIFGKLLNCLDLFLQLPCGKLYL